MEEKKTRKSLEEYLWEAKKIKTLLEKYSRQELVDKLNGYVQKAREMKQSLVSPDDASCKCVMC